MFPYVAILLFHALLTSVTAFKFNPITSETLGSTASISWTPGGDNGPYDISIDICNTTNCPIGYSIISVLGNELAGIGILYTVTSVELSRMEFTASDTDAGFSILSLDQISNVSLVVGDNYAGCIPQVDYGPATQSTSTSTSTAPLAWVSNVTSTVEQFGSQFLSWQGGEPPFDVYFESTKTRLDFGVIEGHSANLTMPFESSSTIKVSLSDASGNHIDGPIFSVLPPAASRAACPVIFQANPTSSTTSASPTSNSPTSLSSTSSTTSASPTSSPTSNSPTSLSSFASSTQTSASSDSTGSATPTPKSAVSSGTIAGAVIGAVVFLVLVAAFLCWRRKYPRRARRTLDMTEDGALYGGVNGSVTPFPALNATTVTPFALDPSRSGSLSANWSSSKQPGLTSVTSRPRVDAVPLKRAGIAHAGSNVSSPSAPSPASASTRRSTPSSPPVPPAPSREPIYHQDAGPVPVEEFPPSYISLRQVTDPPP